jgi:hypothetical protein
LYFYKNASIAKNAFTVDAALSAVIVRIIVLYGRHCSGSARGDFETTSGSGISVSSERKVMRRTTHNHDNEVLTKAHMSLYRACKSFRFFEIRSYIVTPHGYVAFTIIGRAGDNVTAVVSGIVRPRRSKTSAFSFAG